MMLETLPWMPRLVEVLQEAKTDPYYAEFGFSQLEVPPECPTVAGMMPVLTERFNNHYAFRRLGQETMEAWQLNLQDRFDMEVFRLERSLRMYSRPDIDTVGSSERYIGKDTASGTDTHAIEQTGGGTTTRKSRFADTPDTATNLDEDFGSSVSDESGTNTTNLNTTDGTTYGRSDAREYEIVRVDDLIQQLNENLENWKDLISGFISGFEPCFLQILEY